MDGSIQNVPKFICRYNFSHKFPLGLGHNNFPIATIYVNTVHPLSEIFPDTRNSGICVRFSKSLVSTGYLGLILFISFLKND